MNKNGVVGLCFIAFFVGLAYESIGDMPKNPSEPYSWWLPLCILVITGIPFLCGYFGRKP